ncbi:nucleolar protein 58-like [Ornithodoros turicata]|uniref:Nucleolar protein 58 n=1 Tax=Ornithodoros turicata TaxID=34597 RepID=A0A2R5LNZ6_9ACAR
MLVLFESPAGYAIFKVLDEKKLQATDNLYKDFETPDKASRVVKLKHFHKFEDMTQALAAATSAIEGKMSKSLKKVLKKVVATEAHESLAVADAKLGSVIREKFEISCVANSSIQELMRCIRSQAESLITGLPKKEMTAMALGLAHSLSRYKLKFSPDKVDTMIIQAVSLLDDLDKELNNYIMRCKEWYGWHFPELSKVVTDNMQYVNTVKAVGIRTNAITTDLSEILPEDQEAKVKELAEVSMGTEISEEDIRNILHLCEEVLQMSTYRAQLYEYLKNRMMAIAPNLTILVGDLVGARLISHAGSLLSLAKHPASTVQILGAEKALFRALKTKHDTPKYGLIYHAQLIGQSTQRLKGKMSRMLAAKAALATRVDALGDEGTSTELGLEHRAKLECRLKVLEEGGTRRISGTGKAKAKWERYENKSTFQEYHSGADSTLPTSAQKRKFEDEAADEKPTKKVKVEDGEEQKPKKKKKVSTEEEEEPPTSGKKKKKKLSESVDEEVASETPGKKKKKKKSEASNGEEAEEEHVEVKVETSGKKKKKVSESAAVEQDTETPGKKKKKKKAASTGEEEAQEDEVVVKAEPVTPKKKKKKKSKQTEEDE